MAAYYSNGEGGSTHENGSYRVTKRRIEYGEGFLTEHEDQKVLIQVLQNHCPGDFQLVVRPLLQYAESIFNWATQDSQSLENGATEEVNLGIEKEQWPRLIEPVLCVMGRRCPGEGVKEDPHTQTLAVLDVLQDYPWEAKMVVALAALAVCHAEFLSLSQKYSSDPRLANLMGCLKQLPDKARLNAIFCDLMDCMLRLAKGMLSFKDRIMSGHFSAQQDDSVKIVDDTFPVITYWIVRGASAAATHISILTSSSSQDGLLSPASVEQELQMRSEKLKQILETWEQRITHLEMIKEEEDYRKLLSVIGRGHQRTTNVIQILTNSHDDERPLYIRSERIGVDDLRGHTVLLLITNRSEGMDVLMTICREPKTRVLWVPVPDTNDEWNDASLSGHQQVLRDMPCYSVRDPSRIPKEVFTFFKRELNFNGMPTLVAVDSKGMISRTNVLHMARIWGEDANPFSADQAIKHWSTAQASWLDLLLPNNMPPISDWVKESRYIFALGGEVDTRWIT